MRGKTNSVTTSGGSSESSLKKLIDGRINTRYLFYNFNGRAVDDIIKYDDTENSTDANSMFYNCKQLITIPSLNTSKVTLMSSMFYGCQSLRTLPMLDTSKVTNMDNIFLNCRNLQEIAAWDVSNVTSWNNVFDGCWHLKSIHMTGMKVSFRISLSTEFTSADLHEIINNLGTVTSTQTLTMGSTNLSKVSSEYRTIATNKGWTLA